MQKNKTAGKTAKKESRSDYLKNRVVLALSKNDAENLNSILKREAEEKGEDSEFAARIYARLNKNLEKREKGGKKQ